MARINGSGFKMKQSPTKGKLGDFFSSLGSQLKQGQKERGIFSEAGKAKAKEARTPKWKRESDARKSRETAKPEKTSWGTTDPNLNVQDPKSEIILNTKGQNLGSDPDNIYSDISHDLYTRNRGADTLAIKEQIYNTNQKPFIVDKKARDQAMKDTKGKKLTTLHQYKLDPDYKMKDTKSKGYVPQEFKGEKGDKYRYRKTGEHGESNEYTSFEFMKPGSNKWTKAGKTKEGTWEGFNEITSLYEKRRDAGGLFDSPVDKKSPTKKSGFKMKNSPAKNYKKGYYGVK